MLIDLATHGLFEHCIGPSSVVVDLGANRGDFAAAVRHRIRCRLIAVEPNPEVFTELARRDSSIEAICAAVGSADGECTLHLDENSQASTVHPIGKGRYTGGISVPTLTYSTLRTKMNLGHVDLLKIDVEGAEFDLLASMSDQELLDVSQISIELHDFNEMISVQQADEIEDRLKKLGFWRIALSRTNRENVLFYQPDRCRVGLLGHLFASHIQRNMIGVERMISRWTRRWAAAS